MNLRPEISRTRTHVLPALFGAARIFRHADLLLEYLTYVMPLRQRFLRQQSPHAIQSAFLWKQDGKVWPESRLTRCLEVACVRASILRLHMSTWRQMPVAIVKTNFASDLGCFDPEDGDDDDDGEEMDSAVRIMTRQRNFWQRPGWVCVLLLCGRITEASTPSSLGGRRERRGWRVRD